ncbi:hypothetical protein [Streptomyces sp. NPDC002403]
MTAAAADDPSAPRLAAGEERASSAPTLFPRGDPSTSSGPHLVIADRRPRLHDVRKENKMMNASMRTAAAGAVGIAVLVLMTPAARAVGENAGEEAGVICGTDRATGLTVGTALARDCATALQVASAYTRNWNSGGEKVTTVHVAGSVWKCREQPGPLNPYQECVETGGTGRWVTLTS